MTDWRERTGQLRRSWWPESPAARQRRAIAAMAPPAEIAAAFLEGARMAEHNEGVFARAMRNAPWKKSDQEVIDHLSAQPIYDSHLTELLNRFARRVKQDEEQPAFPATLEECEVLVEALSFRIGAAHDPGLKARLMQLREQVLAAQNRLAGLREGSR